MTTDYLHYFKQGLDQLRKDIESYNSVGDLWKKVDGINNSGGTLCYHLLGNLNHFIGAALGKTAYVRDREREFTVEGMSAVDLVIWIGETIIMVEKVISGIQDLQQPYPEHYFKENGSTSFQLMRLLVHFNYHLGQINYHRRILTGRQDTDS